MIIPKRRNSRRGASPLDTIVLCQEVQQLVCETAVSRSAARNVKMAKHLFTCSANQDERVHDFFASLLLSNVLFSLNL